MQALGLSPTCVTHIYEYTMSRDYYCPGAVYQSGIKAMYRRESKGY